MMNTRYNPLNMKQLNREHTATFRSLAEGVGYRKIASEGYIDLTIEMVGRQAFGGFSAMDYSFCHYSELNGDLMRDPEMCFYVIVDEDDEWHVYPHYYRNDYAFGYESECMAFRDGRALVDRKRQNDLEDFAQTWMRNLREQGFVKAAPNQSIERTLQQAEEEEA